MSSISDCEQSKAVDCVPRRIATDSPFMPRRSLHPNSPNSGTRLNDVANSPNLCTGELEYDYYGYTPALGACLAFTILFGLSTLAHLVQGIKGRRWFMLFTMTLCGLGETIGVSGQQRSV